MKKQCSGLAGLDQIPDWNVSGLEFRPDYRMRISGLDRDYLRLARAGSLTYQGIDSLIWCFTVLLIIQLTIGIGMAVPTSVNVSSRSCQVESERKSITMIADNHSSSFRRLRNQQNEGKERAAPSRLLRTPGPVLASFSFVFTVILWFSSLFQLSRWKTSPSAKPHLTLPR